MGSYRSKEPDNLAICSTAAHEAGMSYGQFMAMGGYSKATKRAVPPKTDAPTRVCMHCGKVFSMEGRSHLSKYCSPECQQRASGERARARYHEKRREKN